MKSEQKLKLAQATAKARAAAIKTEQHLDLGFGSDELESLSSALREAQEATLKLIDDQAVLSNKLTEMTGSVKEFSHEVNDGASGFADVNNNLVSLISKLESNGRVIEKSLAEADVDRRAVAELIVKSLGEFVKTIPAPASLPKWLETPDAIEKLREDTVSIGAQIGALAEALKPGQKPEDFLPFRRVYKAGNVLRFDDSYWGGSGGGGGGGSSSVGLTNDELRATPVGVAVSGGATSAKQDTGNTSLASVDTKIPALGQALAVGSTPVVLTAAQIVTLTPPAAITGYATSAKQDTGNISLSSIDTKLSDNATQTTLTTRLSESDFDTKTGSLTETAPATDTASSGLNGRLQRIAQRITSLIALLPAALGSGGGLKVDGSGTALPVSGTVTETNSAAIKSDLDEIALDTDKLDVNLSTRALESGGNLATIAAKDFATQTTLALIKAKTDNLDVALSTRTKSADQQHVIVDTAPTTAVTGPLTDTQLRATPVPVSGTVDPTTPSAVLGFVTTITTAGSRVQLATNACVAGIVQAPSTNTGIVYVGGSNVSASVYGSELQPGQAAGIAINNTNKLYVDAATNGDKLAFLGS